MPDCVLIWREKRAEEALQQEEERAVRLSQLEKSASSANQDGVEGSLYQVSASAPPMATIPEEHPTAPGAGLLSQSSSVQQQ